MSRGPYEALGLLAALALLLGAACSAEEDIYVVPPNFKGPVIVIAAGLRSARENAIPEVPVCALQGFSRAQGGCSIEGISFSVGEATISSGASQRPATEAPTIRSAGLFFFGGILLPLLAVFLGVRHGKMAARGWRTACTVTLLWVTSAFLYAYPWLTRETWARNWWTAVGDGAFVALVLHFGPYLLALWWTRCWQRRKASRRPRVWKWIRGLLNPWEGRAWEAYRAAGAAFLADSAERGLRIATTRFIPISDVSFEAYVFVPTEDELTQGSAKELEPRMRELLASELGRRGLEGEIQVFVDSHERVVREFEGDYLKRLR